MAIDGSVMVDRTLAQTAIDDARVGTLSDSEAHMLVNELFDSSAEFPLIGDLDASTVL